jgi:hypothetical protein
MALGGTRLCTLALALGVKELVTQVMNDYTSREVESVELLTDSTACSG